MNLFPAVPVSVTSGRIIEFGKESFKLYNTRRAPGSDVRRIRFGYQGKPYVLDNHALDAVVPREHLRDASVQPGVDLASRAVNVVRRSQSLELEYEQATLARDAAQYDANHKVALAGTSVWTDKVNSDPITDIENAKEAIRSTVGLYPNTMLFSAKAWKALKQHPLIIDRYKYTNSNVVTTEMVAGLFEVPRVVVGMSLTSDDAGVFSDVWGNDVILANTSLGALGQEEPSYGYTYTMEGHPLVETPYWDQKARSWVYGVGYERAPVLSGITSGYLIQNAG